MATKPATRWPAHVATSLGRASLAPAAGARRTLPEAVRRRVAADLRLLVHERTFLILEQLTTGPQTGAEIARGLRIAERTLGRDVRRLVRKGLVIEDREVGAVRYAARDPGLAEAAARVARVGPIADHPRLLGDPTRLLLLERLGVRDGTVSELSAAAGRSTQCVSRHLQALYALRLVDRRYERGRFVYSLKDRATLELLDLVAGSAVGRAGLPSP
jgi:DNA-binding transcriptional ArsR family regulator